MQHHHVSILNQDRPFSEQYRILGEDWADKEAAAQALEDMKSAVMAQKQALLGDIPVNRAEQTVKASAEWQEYIERMVEARKLANLAKVNLEALRIAWAEEQSTQANRRVEMKMLGDVP